MPDISINVHTSDSSEESASAVGDPIMKSAAIRNVRPN